MKDTPKIANIRLTILFNNLIFRVLKNAGYKTLSPIRL